MSGHAASTRRGKENGRGISRRRFMKTAGQAAGAALAGAGGLALIACEKQPPAQKSARSVHLLQWSNFIKAADEELMRQAKEFETQTGIKTTIETINANDLLARATAAVESGNGPDILQLQSNQPHLYAGGLMNVDKLAEEVGDAHGGFFRVAEEAAKVDGQWRAVPYHLVGGANVYRQDIFQQLGIERFPDTFDEYMTVGKKLKAFGMPVGQSLAHTFGDAPAWCYTLLWSFGGKEVEADGHTVAINSPETRAALEFMAEFYASCCDEGGLSWDDTGNNRAFLAEQISATLNGSSIYFMARSNPDQYPGFADKLNHANMPKGPAGRFNGVLSFQNAIGEYSQHKEEAQELIRFLMLKENFEKWFEISKGFSNGPSPTWSEHPMWERDPAMTAYRGLARDARSIGYAGPYNRKASEVRAKFIIVDIFAKVVQGSETPAGAAAWAERELKLVYERG